MPGLEPADVIWASMSLHHIGDEAAALRLLGELLAPQGLLAIAEIAERAEHLRMLPEDLDVGRPGLMDRIDGTDRDALDILTDLDDPRGAMHRTDLFVASSQQIVIARPTA